jgi:two-component system, sensor histidine kinase RegB
VGDILVLTGLLYCSGGPSNPFSVMYLVNVTLAALVLGVRWAGAMVALSAVLYAALFFWHVPVPELSHAHHHMRGDRSGASPFSIHLQGMWVAFTVAAALIGYFVARVAGSLRAREADLAAARAASARTERLASLTTLAAGAAHELGTPLGTIAVAAKELERTFRESSDEALDDARLIRTEVERCRAIVQRMSAQAGETMGEVPRGAAAEEIVRGGIERLGREAVAGVVVESGVEAAVLCPVEGAMQVLSSIIQNARWAVRDGGTVTVSWSPTPAGVALMVSDDGVGIAEKQVARIGEPFVTTKAPGEGMGLGVFLARTFAERCGGSLHLESVEGVGTKVTMTLPHAPEEAIRG